MLQILFAICLFTIVSGYGAELTNTSGLGLSPTVAPIKVVGNKFFDTGTGSQFFMKGIAYQRTRMPHEELVGFGGTTLIDSMANEVDCLRDLGNFMDLGVNVVRVYQVDTSADHDVCMNAYAKAGIYVLADLSEPEVSVNRDLPAWDLQLYQRYTSVIDIMQKYNNTLGFIAGNEVTNSPSNTEASAFVKASIRDMKTYISEQGYREIPVGYATNDDADIRMALANYMVCSHKSESADFIGVNMYEWCGFSSYTTSGYRDRTVEFSNFPVPLFFSEYGCNSVTPRPFTEVEALYGRTMSQVWSGGIAYEYFNGVNKYGLVKINEDGTLSKTEDYQILKQRLNSVSAHTIQLEDYEAKEQEVACGQAKVWKATTSLPPTPDKGKCECLESSLECVVAATSFNYEALKADILSKVDCHEIQSNATIGYYGMFSDCTESQKLSFCANKYYAQREVCDGDNIIVQASADDNCKQLLQTVFATNANYDNVIRSRHSNPTILNDTSSSIQFKDSKKVKSSGFKVTVQLLPTVILLLLAHGI